MVLLVAAADETRLAGDFQARQRALSAGLVRQIVEILQIILNLGDFDGTWPAARRALVQVIRAERRASADIGAVYYRQARSAAGLGAATSVGRPRPLSPERLEKALDGAGPAVFRKSLRLGATPVDALDRMAVTVSGTATRLALEGGRDVVENSVREDDDALGWARISDGDPCAWCAMLLSRGAIYKSAKTAGSVAHGGELFHDHDGCQIVPIFDKNSPLVAQADDLYEQWKRVTSGHSGAEARKVWRRYWDGRDAGEPALT